MAALALLLAGVAGSLPAAGQGTGGVAASDSAAHAGGRAADGVAFEVFAGSELERYLRTLQNVGRTGLQPWSVRGFSAGDVRRMARPGRDHPWAGRYRFAAADSAAGVRRLEYGLLRPRLRAFYNSAFPYGGNDGPVWAGRGLTTEARIGAYLRYGPLSLVVAPVAFRAENEPFELAPVAGGDDRRFENAVSGGIDLPQRFGPEPYARIDPGYSTLRLDGYGISAGVSTAPQGWGPMDTHPLMLGSNAPGFPHAFVATERPLDVWIGDLHGRYVVGRLAQSEWAPETEREAVRAAPGFVVAFRPRGLGGLEVGLTRFIHREWPEEGIGASEIFQPLEALFKEAIPDADTRFPDNQLLSAFARWSFPEAGLEVMGEFVREDHATDARVLALEPDDLSGYALGLRRVWDGGGRTLTIFRAEMLRTVSSHRQRFESRPGLARRAYHMYKHGRIPQGHTHRGQLLASPAGHAGQASVVAVDRYTERGRWTVEVERRVRRDRTAGVVPEDAAEADVLYAVGGEVLRFRGPVDVRAGLRALYELNRHLRRADRFGVHLTLAASARLP